MAKQILNPDLTFKSSRGAGLDSVSCAIIPVIFLPPNFYCFSVGILFPGRSGTPLSWSWKPPGMTTLSRKKSLVTRALVRISNRGHITGRALGNFVAGLVEIIFNESYESCRYQQLVSCLFPKAQVYLLWRANCHGYLIHCRMRYAWSKIHHQEHHPFLQHVESGFRLDYGNHILELYQWGGVGVGGQSCAVQHRVPKHCYQCSFWSGRERERLGNKTYWLFPLPNLGLLCVTMGWVVSLLLCDITRRGISDIKIPALVTQ